MVWDINALFIDEYTDRMELQVNGSLKESCWFKSTPKIKENNTNHNFSTTLARKWEVQIHLLDKEFTHDGVTHILPTEKWKNRVSLHPIDFAQQSNTHLILYESAELEL